MALLVRVRHNVMRGVDLDRKNEVSLSERRCYETTGWLNCGLPSQDVAHYLDIVNPSIRLDYQAFSLHQGPSTSPRTAHVSSPPNIISRFPTQ